MPAVIGIFGNGSLAMVLPFRGSRLGVEADVLAEADRLLHCVLRYVERRTTVPQNPGGSFTTLILLQKRNGTKAHLSYVTWQQNVPG